MRVVAAASYSTNRLQGAYGARIGAPSEGHLLVGVHAYCHILKYALIAETWMCLEYGKIHA
uniref:Uncharacterized protein n=1 Tax=Parascaris univalens TaxID=6257 RepID=A0A915BQV4_PARUN